MEFDTDKGKVVIEKAVVSDLKDLIPIYKEVFKIHEIFTKSDEEILMYLEKNVSGFLIAKVNEKVVGGVLVRQVDEGWRLSHLVVADGFRDLNIGSHLLKAAEEKIGSGKITVHLSANEETALPFYKKNGFSVEKEEVGYYREGEKVFFLVKEI
jgi:ribosomal protein S18 acetylase RimI-like enzyme